MTHARSESPGAGWFPTLLVLFCGMAASVGASFFVEAPAGAGARPHPTAEAMLAGGAAANASSALYALALGFGACVLTSLAVFLGLALGRSRTVAVVAALALNLPFAAVVLTYPGYVDDPTAETLLGLPAPTSWMLLVLFPAGAVFVLSFLRGFERLYWPRESAERYEALSRGSDRESRAGSAETGAPR